MAATRVPVCTVIFLFHAGDEHAAVRVALPLRGACLLSTVRAVAPAWVAAAMAHGSHPDHPSSFDYAQFDKDPTGETGVRMPPVTEAQFRERGEELVHALLQFAAEVADVPNTTAGVHVPKHDHEVWRPYAMNSVAQNYLVRHYNTADTFPEALQQARALYDAATEIQHRAEQRLRQAWFPNSASFVATAGVLGDSVLGDPVYLDAPRHATSVMLVVKMV